LSLAALTFAAVVATPAPYAASPRAAAPIAIATFNVAWAGTPEDFRQHLRVCGAPAVNWCDTRARAPRGAGAPTAEEKARAEKCQADTIAVAGGKQAAMMIAPCNAYRFAAAPARGAPPRDAALLRTAEAHAGKLAGLAATVGKLIDEEGARVIAFQEVKSREAVVNVLGRHAPRFEVCVAKHDAFQTLAFAWDKSLSMRPGVCATYEPLAILDPPDDPAAFRRVRPGLALELHVNGEPVTFLNVHLKSGCANIVATERFPARLLDDPHEACEVLNRQTPLLESWIDGIVAKKPRLVWLGDFNRRIDEEAAADLAKDRVRADGTDPAAPNRVDARGKVATRYLWPELADGAPLLHQVPLSQSDGACQGFVGLDHIVISDAVKRDNPGTIVSKKMAVVTTLGQIMETADHCPRVAVLRL
jgi:endonuclease/exonuclease/phosphatase family metal-dependent hydrolase